MDNFLRRFRKKKPPPPPRREPLRNADQLIRSDEAKEKIVNAVGKYGPGVPLRWDKMLQIINTNVEPTEENYDPLRVETDKEELKLVLRHLYDNKKSIASDGLALAREFIPLLYDKHTVDRALNVSQRERDQRGITDECYAYGELDHEIFAAMYLRLVFVYGEKQNGIFYDLGCGVGTLVYTAAFIGQFERVFGIENIAALLERGEKRTQRFERYQSSYTEKIRNVLFDWVEDDFTTNGFWTDGDFILLHWTAFTNEQQRTITKTLATCKEGAFVVTFTSPIPGEDYDILVRDTCVTSWGLSEFYFQEKITPAKKRTV